MIVKRPTSSNSAGRLASAADRPSGKIIVDAASGSNSVGLGNSNLYWQTSQIDIKSLPVSFNKLGAKDRAKRLAKSDPFGFATSIFGVPLALYLIFRALDETLKLFSISARADTSGPMQNFVTGSSRDAFDWYVGALMGLVLIISICATFYASDNKKIEFGKDMTKTIVGFLVGFLGGGKIVAK